MSFISYLKVKNLSVNNEKKENKRSFDSLLETHQPGSRVLRELVCAGISRWVEVFWWQKPESVTSVFVSSMRETQEALSWWEGNRWGRGPFLVRVPKISSR